MSDFDAMRMGGSGGFTPMSKPDKPTKQPETTVADEDLPAPLLARSQDLRTALEADMRRRIPPIPEPRRLRGGF